jgi:hypothetical protein
MSRMPIKFLLTLLLLWIAPGSFRAANADGELEGEIRFQAARAGDAWVGQEQELQLELWTTGFSFAEQLFVLPEVRGGYLIQPDSSTVKLSEDRNGTPWQGLRYTILLYPQREGQLEVPSFDVSFTARAGFGTEPARFQQSTEPVVIASRLPPGARPGSLLVTTSSFRLESSWNPDFSADGPIVLRVGEAITLSVTRSAEDVPGMIFDPLPVPKIDGLGIYPGTPEVKDRVNRGTLTGRRVDSITFICEREGSYRIPGFQFQWWDPQGEVLSERKIEPVELAVIANPAYAAGSGQAALAAGMLESWRWLLVLLVVIVGLLFALRALLPRARGYLRTRQLLYESSEAWAFKQVRRACETGQAVEACNAINLWLGRAYACQGVIGLTDLARESGNKDFIKEATALQESVASVTTREWSGRKLARLLRDQRKNPGQSLKPVYVLQDLNPSPLR